MIESRHIDLNPVQCKDCSWQGALAECIHTYEGLPGEDVVPVDLCPTCRGRDLIEILPDYAQLEAIPV